jgi:hypothetical protein
MVSLDWVPVQNPAVVGRFVGDEAVLVLPLKGQVKVLNEVGARIWSLMDGIRTVKEISAVIFDEFSTSEDEVMKDAQDFCEQLAEREIITFSKGIQP